MSIARRFVGVVGCGLALSAVACGADSAPASPDGGAPAQKLSVRAAVFHGEGQPLTALEEGGVLPLVVPPQGGHVVFVGALIEGARTDYVKLTSTLTEPSGKLLASDARTVALEVDPEQPTRKRTRIVSYTQQSNLTLCPNYAPRAVDGQTAHLTVEVSELYVDAPTPVKTELDVTPTCPANGADSAACACECGASYVLGKCNGP